MANISNNEIAIDRFVDKLINGIKVSYDDLLSCAKPITYDSDDEDDCIKNGEDIKFNFDFSMEDNIFDTIWDKVIKCGCKIPDCWFEFLEDDKISYKMKFDQFIKELKDYGKDQYIHKNSKILTCNRGYVKAKEIKHTHVIGDNEKTTKIEKSKKVRFTGDIYEITVECHPQNVPIEASANQLFLVKKKETGLIRFVRAKNIEDGDLIGCHINKKSDITTFNYSFRRQDKSLSMDKRVKFYMTGYYIGDGFILEKKKDGDRGFRTILIFNKTYKREALKIFLDEVDMTKRKPRKDRPDDGCDYYTLTHKGFHTVFSSMGKYSHGKLIPKWLYDSPIDMIEGFIEGYLIADGTRTRANTINLSTVSPHLAYGLQKLYLKLNTLVSIGFYKMPKKKIIQGKECNQRDIYKVTRMATNNLDTMGNGMISHIDYEKGYAWFGVKNIECYEVEDYKMHSIKTTSGSFIIENLVAHTCKNLCLGKDE